MVTRCRAADRLRDSDRNAARQIVTDSGADDAEWEKLQRRIDVENVAWMAYSPDRFPTSCVQAYEELCRARAVAGDSAVASRIREAARRVFERDAELAPAVHDVLTELRDSGVRLALLTKGDLAVQRRRVERSGLEGYFALVRIVPEKSATEIRQVVDELRGHPANS